MIPIVAILALAAAPAQLRPAPPRPVLPSPEVIDAAAASLLQRASEGEPSLGAVQEAAARHALRGRALPTGRRARLAALLPKLSVELQRDDRRYRVIGLTSSAEVDYVRDNPGSQVSVRLSWDLAGLAFADAELRLAEKDEAAAKARADAVERATKLYFERRRLLLALVAAPPGSARERAEREVEVEELGGVLDAMTGGLWTAGAAR